MLRRVAACSTILACIFLIPPVPAAEPARSQAGSQVEELLKASKASDWQAFGNIAYKIEQQLAQKGEDAEALAGKLLDRKSELVSNADVTRLLDEMTRKQKAPLAAELLVRIASARRVVHSFKRGHVIVGRVVVADGKIDPELIMAQMPILAEGYFAGEVGDLQRPVGFRAHGYQNLDVPLAGKEGDMVYVGKVTLNPLPKAQRATLKGKIVLDAAKTAETAEVLLSMNVDGINTPHNGYSPRRRWPGPIKVSVASSGEFTATGLSPSSYYLQIKAREHVDLAKPVAFQAGRSTDLGACRLQAADLGFYIGSAAPKTEDLKWEKDCATALKRAAAEKKPVLIMMTATWCGPCKMLEKETLNDPWVRYFLSDFIVVKAYEDKDVEKKYGFAGYPTLVFTDSSGKAAYTTTGYKPRLTFSGECAKALTKLDRKLPSELQTLVDKKIVSIN
ncbi:MAG TPA: thioredoxin family protein [Gemmataceae bacterium]|nr:thioredoxin family protein [Gemmataceae bacterium]